MARTLTKEKAAALAAEYVCNGFHKGQALRSVGYSKAYSETTNGCKLFDHELVRAEMAKIVNRNKDAVDVTVSEIIQGLRETAFPAEGVKVNNSDRNRALELLGKFKSMFSDRLILGADQQERELAENEKIECEVLAEIRNRYGDRIKAEVERRMAPQLESFTDSEIRNG
jgi:hypothetical protein